MITDSSSVLWLLRELKAKCVSGRCMVSLQIGGVGTLEDPGEGHFRILITDDLVYPFTITDGELLDLLNLRDEILTLWESGRKTAESHARKHQRPEPQPLGGP